MIYNLVFIFLFMLGLYTVTVKKNLIKMVIGLNIMETAVFFWVITINNRGGSFPIYQLDNINQTLVDPIPQALILTGIVIGASTTALLLTLIIELNKFTTEIDISKLRGLRD